MKVKRFNFQMSDMEAVAAIRKLPKLHQPIIGRIVWWDWFALRLVAKRTAAFDHWMGLAEPNEPKPEALMKSLMKLGYPQDLAWSRVRTKGLTSK